MERKTFLKLCGYTCLGIGTVGLLMPGCAPSKIISMPIEGDVIRIPLSEFSVDKNGSMEFLRYLIVSNDQLQFPIYVYRFSETEFSALYLRCTHQGNELNAYGDRLVCSAHGSEFDPKGNVINGPADTALKTFPTLTDGQYLILSLKA